MTFVLKVIGVVDQMARTLNSTKHPFRMMSQVLIGMEKKLNLPIIFPAEINGLYSV